ncbi:erythrocyte membrane protein 1, EMP1, partial [Plasmodium reichenowi]
SVEKSGSSSSSGSICVPPRRRRLYIKKIQDWAESQGKGDKQVEGEGKGGSSEKSQANGESSDSSGRDGQKTPVSSGRDGSSEQSGQVKANDQGAGSGDGKPGGSDGQTATQPPDPLLEAFIQSAAVETFFLWDRYKKEWEHKNKPQNGGLLGLSGGVGTYSEAMGGWGTGSQSGSSVGGIFGNKDPSQLAGARAGPRLQFGAGLGGTPGGFPGGPYPQGLGLSESSWTAAAEPGAQRSLFNTDEGTSQTGELDGNLLNNRLQLRTPSQPQQSQLQPLSLTLDSDPENTPPQTLLASGNIPPDFLRQMFYTLGDYRDILVGNVPHGIDKVSATVDDQKEKDASGKESDMKKIKNALNSYFSNSENQSQSRVNTPSQPSDKTRQTLWGDFAQNIWHGMICALTYEDKSEIEAKKPDGTTTLQRNNDVYNKFFGDENKTDKPTPSTNTGTFYKEYQYSVVKLSDKDSDSTGPKTVGPNGDSPTSSTATGSTTLADFTSRPAYFRYLEEWGETFCRERKRRLDKIKHECKVEENGDRRRGGNGGTKTPKCSCYGEDCDEISKQNYDIISNFKCPKCGKYCRLYKRWIRKKKEEYDEQEKAYNTELESAKSNNGAKEFCGTLGKDAADFLKRLKNGPCKNNNDDNENRKGKTIFDNIGDTFKPAKNCGTCSKFSVNCKSGKCDNEKGTNCRNKNSISAEDIETMVNSTDDVSMVVSDNSGNGNGFESVLPECTNVHIFNGIRKDVWKCGYVCGVDVCEQTNVNEGTDGKEYIQIRALLAHWVHNFLEDYNRIRTKLKLCTNSGEQTICIKDCGEKCTCVEKWINKKRDEWPNIRDRYVKQYNGGDTEKKTLVRNFLEDLQSQIDVNKSIGSSAELRDFESKICNCTKSSKTKDTDERDIIQCLLDRLQQKAEKCQKQHIGEPNQPCGDNSAPKQTPPEEPFEEEEDPENQVEKPNICGDMKTTEEKVVDDKCEEEKNPSSTVTDEEGKEKTEEAPSAPPSTPSPTEGPDQDIDNKPKENQVTEDKSQPRGEKKTNQQPTPQVVPPKPPVEKNPFNHPHVQTALASSTLAWSKKTTRPVDLFSIMEIPQNDYDMPTLKSKNRYTPYKSAQYRGKRYIYIEGDSGTDSGYTDHYSDITSSSESEYEELDINDIYVPGTPKYKTLIEVVLEPSKRDTQSDIQNDDTTTNKLTNIEWNQLKDEFISIMLQNEQNTEPNDYTSGDIPTNTNNTTPSHDNVDNNTHPIPSRDHMYQKPFIMSIHDRNLLSGEEYNYDMSNNSGIYPSSSNRHSLSGTKNPISDNRDSYSGKNNTYSGTDLINDSLNSGNQPIDIYDELLKRKENELFGTEHKKKNTSTNSVAKNTYSDPITNQLNLFHKWLDRHRNMCEKCSNKVEMLDKLKEGWDNDNNNNSGNKTSGNITPTSGIPSDNNMHSDIHPSDIPSGNKTLNSDVSIQIHMDNPKTTNEFTYVDNISPNLVGHPKPVDENPTNPNLVGNPNPVDENPTNPNPNHVQIEMDVNNHKLVEENYPIRDMWDI